MNRDALNCQVRVTEINAPVKTGQKSDTNKGRCTLKGVGRSEVEGRSSGLEGDNKASLPDDNFVRTSGRPAASFVWTSWTSLKVEHHSQQNNWCFVARPPVSTTFLASTNFKQFFHFSDKFRMKMQNNWSGKCAKTGQDTAVATCKPVYTSFILESQFSCNFSPFPFFHLSTTCPSVENRSTSQL